MSHHIFFIFPRTCPIIFYNIGGWERCNREIKDFLCWARVRERECSSSLGPAVEIIPAAAAAPPRVFPQSSSKLCEF